MTRRSLVAVAVGLTVLAGVGVSLMSAQQPTPPPNDKPLTDKWAPTEWGANDKVGAPNRTTPAMVLKAVRLVKQGKVATLGKLYHSSIPAFGPRSWTMSIPGTPTGGPFGKNMLVYHDEYLATEIGQTGTQFDGLGHIGVLVGAEGDLNAMRFYNGVTGAEMVSAYGLKKLGVEKVKPFFTRGILLDVAGYKGRMLDRGEEISLADVRATMARQGIADIRRGDVVLFHTGWGSLWMKDNARFDSGEPGIGLEVARWLADRQIACVGSDTWATEVQPNPDPNVRAPSTRNC